jgi:preprotein translocase subunit SecA
LLISQTIFRLVGAVERRLEEPLEINPQELMTADWETLANRILSTVEGRFEQRLQRYVGDGSSGEGQISRDLENVLQRMPEEVDASMLVNLLVMLPQGSKASFDKRTHRRVLQRTTRLTYIHFAASYLENHEPAEISEDVLSHLESAHQAMVQAWGISEINRLSNFTIADLDEYARSQFAENLDQEPDEQFFSQPLGSLAEEDREAAVEVLGRRSLTEIYRQLLLNVITELWVDYLTQMEALRISIGLEAYGQRDPLVQYKNRAFSLFQNLLGDMRLGVINRMFTYRPRDMAAVQSVPSKSESPMIADTVAEAEEEQIVDEEMEAGEAVAQAGSQGKSAAREQDGGKKKRRRHR